MLTKILWNKQHIRHRLEEEPPWNVGGCLELLPTHTYTQCCSILTSFSFLEYQVNWNLEPISSPDRFTKIICCLGWIWTLFCSCLFEHWWSWSTFVQHCWFCCSRLLFHLGFTNINIKRWHSIVDILGCFCLFQCYWILVQGYLVLDSILLLVQDCIFVVHWYSKFWWCQCCLQCYY